MSYQTEEEYWSTTKGLYSSTEYSHSMCYNDGRVVGTSRHFAHVTMDLQEVETDLQHEDCISSVVGYHLSPKLMREAHECGVRIETN